MFVRAFVKGLPVGFREAASCSDAGIFSLPPVLALHLYYIKEG